MVRRQISIFRYNETLGCIEYGQSETVMRPHSDPEIQRRWEAATTIALEAGRLTLEFFRRNSLTVDRKADTTPVTVADKMTETMMRERIMAIFPEDAILGEEFGTTPGTTPGMTPGTTTDSGADGWLWVLDPIDGTKSFIHGVPLYGTLIGVGHRDSMGQYVPVIGVAVIPAVIPGGECVTAAIGGGAWVLREGQEPELANVSNVATLAEATLATSETKYFALTGNSGLWERLERTVGLAMSWGDAFGYVQVALGRAEIMVDAGLSLWDGAAIVPIITEAGGRCSNWNGEPQIESGNLVATNGRLHDELLRLLAKSEQ